MSLWHRNGQDSVTTLISLFSHRPLIISEFAALPMNW